MTAQLAAAAPLRGGGRREGKAGPERREEEEGTRRRHRGSHLGPRLRASRSAQLGPARPPWALRPWPPCPPRPGAPSRGSPTPGSSCALWPRAAAATPPAGRARPRPHCQRRREGWSAVGDRAWGSASPRGRPERAVGRGPQCCEGFRRLWGGIWSPDPADPTHPNSEESPGFSFGF